MATSKANTTTCQADNFDRLAIILLLSRRFAPLFK